MNREVSIKIKILAIGILIIVLGIITKPIYRSWSNRIAVVEERKMNNGVTCYTIITDDGAGINCLKTEELR